MLGISLLAAGNPNIPAVTVQLDGENKELRWDVEREDIAVKISEFLESHRSGEPYRNEMELVLRQVRAQLAGRRADVGTLPPKNGASVKQVLPPSKGTQIALYNSHEANIAISIDGRVQCVLELERLFGVRYFVPSQNATERRQEWLRAAHTMRDRCECEGGPCPRRFDTGILVRPSSEAESNIIEEVFPVDEWRYVDHQDLPLGIPLPVVTGLVHCIWLHMQLALSLPSRDANLQKSCPKSMCTGRPNPPRSKQLLLSCCL